MTSLFDLEAFGLYELSIYSEEQEQAKWFNNFIIDWTVNSPAEIDDILLDDILLKEYGIVWRIGFFYFKSADDAVAFILRWS